MVFMVLMSSLENAQAANSQPSVVVQQVDGKPVIDGFLNEEEWMRAKKIRNFGQVEPREGKEASERTEVSLMRTDEALYLGVRCFDLRREEGKQCVMKRHLVCRCATRTCVM